MNKARAHWLDRDTFAWDYSAEGGEQVFLVYKSEGGLSEESALRDGTTIELERVGEGLSGSLREKSPHLREYAVYRLREEHSAAVLEILQSQIILVAAKGNTVIKSTGVQIPGVLDDLYAYHGTLGAVVREDGSVQLSVWAPTAKSVSVVALTDVHGRVAQNEEYVHYTDSSVEHEHAVVSQLYRSPGNAGVWELDAAEAEHGKTHLQAGTKYKYRVEVYDRLSGSIRCCDVTDPYSRALTTDSTWSVAVDLVNPVLKPDGWDELVHEKPPLEHFVDMVLYELHVRDFSINDQTVSEDKRGKYTAFTEASSNGVAHLKALSQAGLTHVHLLPVFDIASVPEDPSARIEPSIPTDAGTASHLQAEAVRKVQDVDSFNWGYDPWHYAVPEGSYAVSPNGPMRTLEFRHMVQSLNRMGLRVVMDVVYNHTFASGFIKQAEYSVFDKIVPGYYYRLDMDGDVEESTCMNNTASEHAMMEKLMLDSLRVWATHYKVDGFRFDLMGHHMKDTMLKIRTMLDGIDPTICMYGEGWDFGEVAHNARGVNATQHNMAGTGIGTFNDRVRDAVRGGGAFDSGQSLVTNQGFCNGLYVRPNENNHGSPEEKAALLQNSDIIRVALAANLADYTLEAADGTVKRGQDIDYKGSPAGYNQSPREHIAYVSAHDNQTLYDNNVYKLRKDCPMRERVATQQLAVDIPLMCQGVPFLHAGCEMLRSKSLERDSYNSGDWFNRLYFDHSHNNFGIGLPVEPGGDESIMVPLLQNASFIPNKSDITEMVGHVGMMLQIRQSSRLFRLNTRDEVLERVRFHNTGARQIPGVVVMSISDKTVTEAFDWRAAETNAPLSPLHLYLRANQLKLDTQVPLEDLDPERELVIVCLNATATQHRVRLRGHDADETLLRLQPHSLMQERVIERISTQVDGTPSTPTNQQAQDSVQWCRKTTDGRAYELLVPPLGTTVFELPQK
ncbi:hypothetical protein SARC_05365 [Sphaeroforma arctica JP610]|uniref:Pullulanase n=1 Tax=Sphaeroforma arctica JP610 TaxID=667725 RepID=A0A0L0FZR9_9EUKA|nr:hypothetical protein, variant [Sphaeroforma arctica JP610]XP_014156254.1 hypothetical protein SARC_05365 [Sphaeroforma arctica JP610]KNC82351.1 hypothetical protein, variant [Sphaeroforma arctica JP610]KNC82352.1 hypothetical protein SARC_05365 [Sphaeroforma arctica JP610]|eukprot:XP_014156253.1 hypothetical protein, variant [Sphaeroforma arctica JP610]